MITDLVIPRENENELILEARKLGYQKIILLYSPKEYEEKLALARELAGLYQNFRVEAGVIIDSTKAKNLNNYQKKLRCLTVGRGFSPQFFRKNTISSVFELELSSTGGSKYRSSGLNQVLCMEAVRSGTKLGISISEVINSGDAEILGRIVNNIRIAQKYGMEITAASLARAPYEMRSPHDIRGLLRTLGVSGENAARSLEQ